MKKERILIGLMLLTAAGLLAGCGGAAAASEPTEVPVVADTSGGAVVAEAVIEPARWEQLSFEMGGKVIDVLVPLERGGKSATGRGRRSAQPTHWRVAPSAGPYWRL